MCQTDFDLVLPLTYGFHIVIYFVCVFFVLYWYCSDLFVESGDFESIWNCYCTCFCYKTLNDKIPEVKYGKWCVVNKILCCINE